MGNIKLSESDKDASKPRSSSIPLKHTASQKSEEKKWRRRGKSYIQRHKSQRKRSGGEGVSLTYSVTKVRGKEVEEKG